MVELKFRTVKHVTIPILRVPDTGTPIYVRIDGAIKKAKPILGNGSSNASTENSGDSTAPKRAMQAPELMQVLNLETGEECQIIVNTVLGSSLREAYPNDGYVGHSFEIRKFKMQGGKKYATFQIAEIEVEEPEKAPAAASPATPAKSPAASQATAKKHGR